MNKLIIDNRTELNDIDALRVAKVVIEQGRISNDGKQYCYATEVEINNLSGKYTVYSDLNKKSDRLVIL